MIRDGTPDCAIVDVGHRRALELRIEVAGSGAGRRSPPTSCSAEIYDRIAALVQAHRTTIVFVNTRRLVERVAHALSERLGAEQVAAHHGSLSRETRLAAETGLKCGASARRRRHGLAGAGHRRRARRPGLPSRLRRVPWPRCCSGSAARGTSLGAVPKGILFPLTRDDLLQCAAAVRAVARRRARSAGDSGEPARHPRAADGRHRRQRRGGGG